MTSLFELLPEDIIQEIVETCPESTINLAFASKQLYTDVRSFADLYINTHYRDLKPSSTSPIITYQTMLDDEMFYQWGCSNSSFEKEQAFVEACNDGDLEDVKYIYSLGVDIDVSNFLEETSDKNLPNALESAIEEGHDHIVQFLVERNVCCYIDNVRDAIRKYNETPTDKSLKIVRHLLFLYSKYGRYDDIYDLFIWGNNRDGVCKQMKRVLDDSITTLIPYGTISAYSGVCQACASNIYSEDLFFCYGALKCFNCKKIKS
jgi:hypothetical protein